MLGLMVLLAFGFYLAVSGLVVLLAARWARKRNRRPWLWGGLAAFAMYNLVFWDWIPTVVMHKYYCAKESGFWVYKTLDQWKTENPGVMETLVDNSPGEYPNWPIENWNGKKVAGINQRFAMFYTNHLSSKNESELFLHVWRWKSELIDKKTGDVLARRVDFSTGNGNIGGELELRFWLHRDSCSRDRENAVKFGEFIRQFRGAKK